MSCHSPSHHVPLHTSEYGAVEATAQDCPKERTILRLLELSYPGMRFVLSKGTRTASKKRGRRACPARQRDLRLDLPRPCLLRFEFTSLNSRVKPNSSIGLSSNGEVLLVFPGLRLHRVMTCSGSAAATAGRATGCSEMKVSNTTLPDITISSPRGDNPRSALLGLAPCLSS